MSLNSHFLAFKRSGSRSVLVRAEMLSLSNLPSLEDARGSGDGEFFVFILLEFPTQLRPEIFCVRVCEARQK